MLVKAPCSKPLLVGGNRARRDRLDRRSGKRPAEDMDDEDGVDHPACARERIEEEAERSDREAADDRAPLAEPGHDEAHQDALRDRKQRAEGGEREADRGRAPAIAVAGIEHPDALQHALGEIGEDEAEDERGDRRILRDHQESPDRVGLAEPEAAAVLLDRAIPAAGNRRARHRRATGPCRRRRAAGSSTRRGLPPRKGPAMKPTPSATPIRPKFWARLSGGLMSAM